MYQKVGKFGASGKMFGNSPNSPLIYPIADQIKGFGFMHDGSMDTLDNFLRGEVFELAYTPASICEALKENRVLPSLFTCFLTLSFARGMVCPGGYFIYCDT